MRLRRVDVRVVTRTGASGVAKARATANQISMQTRNLPHVLFQKSNINWDEPFERVPGVFKNAAEAEKHVKAVNKRGVNICISVPERDEHNTALINRKLTRVDEHSILSGREERTEPNREAKREELRMINNDFDCFMSGLVEGGQW